MICATSMPSPKKFSSTAPLSPPVAPSPAFWPSCKDGKPVFNINDEEGRGEGGHRRNEGDAHLVAAGGPALRLGRELLALLALRLLRLLPALLYLSIDEVVYTRTCRFVNDELVEARDLARAVRAEEVTLEQVRLHALLAVQRPAARRLDCVPEELAVDWALERRVRRWAVADIGLGEALVPRYLLLPGSALDDGVSANEK